MSRHHMCRVGVLSDLSFHVCPFPSLLRIVLCTQKFNTSRLNSLFIWQFSLAGEISWTSENCGIIIGVRFGEQRCLSTHTFQTSSTQEAHPVHLFMDRQGIPQVPGWETMTTTLKREKSIHQWDSCLQVFNDVVLPTTVIKIKSSHLNLNI